VNARLLFVVLLGMTCAVCAQAADRREADGIIDKFDAVRPTAVELAIYQLDWQPTLKAAKEKATRENRPIFLVVVTNSFGDVCTGHC
jgi:hypothetical protein